MPTTHRAEPAETHPSDGTGAAATGTGRIASAAGRTAPAAGRTAPAAGRTAPAAGDAAPTVAPHSAQASVQNAAPPRFAATDRPAAVALGIAAVLFVAYPALRPWSDETTLAGAQAMSSTAWVLSHLFGMIAFTVMSAGLWRGSARNSSAEPGALVSHRRAALFAASGTALILPYYGGETFGIQAIAARAVADADVSLLEVVDAFRFGPVAMALFGAGLLALAVAGVMLWRATWRGGALARMGGLLAGSQLILYLPQFFTPPGVRIAHGVLLGAGLAMLAVQAWRTQD